MSVSVFGLIRLIPGDPASLMLVDLATPASIADLQARLGLDQSLPVQFAEAGIALRIVEIGQHHLLPDHDAEFVAER